MRLHKFPHFWYNVAIPHCVASPRPQLLERAASLRVQYCSVASWPLHLSCLWHALTPQKACWHFRFRWTLEELKHKLFTWFCKLLNVLYLLFSPHPTCALFVLECTWLWSPRAQEVSISSGVYPGKEALLAVTTGGWLAYSCWQAWIGKNQNIRQRTKREDFRFPLSTVTFVTWAQARPKHVSTVG